MCYNNPNTMMVHLGFYFRGQGIQFSGKRIWQVHQYTILVTFTLSLFITFYEGQSQICDLKEITKIPKTRPPRKLPEIRYPIVHTK